MIDETILIQYGAVEIILEKGTFLFHEKERAAHYFQVKTGKIKMFKIKPDFFTRYKIFVSGMKIKNFKIDGIVSQSVHPFYRLF